MKKYFLNIKKLNQIIFKSSFFAFAFLNYENTLNGQDTLEVRLSKVEHRYRVDKIRNKETGRLMSDAEVNALISKNPRLNMYRVINEYGEVTELIYDKNIPQDGTYNPRDTSLRIKVGEPILPFVFKTIDKKKIKSKDLIGKIVIVRFCLHLNEKTPLSKHEELKNIAALDPSIVIIFLSPSPKEELETFAKRLDFDAHYVPDDFFFQERYRIIQINSFMVVDKKGNLLGYFNDIDALKKGLKPLLGN